MSLEREKHGLLNNGWDGGGGTHGIRDGKNCSVDQGDLISDLRGHTCMSIHICIYMHSLRKK